MTELLDSLSSIELRALLELAGLEVENDEWGEVAPPDDPTYAALASRGLVEQADVGFALTDSTRVFAEAIADPERGSLYVDAWAMVGPLLAAQKHSIREIETLRSENAALHAALAALTSRVAALETR